MAQIGRYELLGELGRGAMGIVYRAMDPVIGRTIAIKTIRFGELSDPEEYERLRERLFREARSAGKLSHPHIVTIYDIGQDGETAFIAMEFVDGASLAQVSRRGPIEPEAVVTALSETASGLDYAHSKGIVHRDVKPANIMINDAGTVKITDFGVAKILSQNLTKTDAVLGTPTYMSPEQVETKPVGGQADQFSLAVIAYELLTGEKPFTGDTLPSVLYKIVKEPPAQAHLLNRSISPAVSGALARGMSKEPEQRYPTCTEFVSALNDALIYCPRWAPLARGAAATLPTVAEIPSPKELKQPPPAAVPPRTDAPPQPVEPDIHPRARKLPSEGGWGKYVVAAVLGALAIAAVVGGRRFLEQSPPVQQQPAPPQATVEPPKPSPVGEATQPAPQPEPPKETATPAPSAAPPAPAAVPPAPIESPQPRPRPIARSGSAVVEISSWPRGARASIDNTGEGCVTPCSMELSGGRHVLNFSLPGHRPATSIFVVPQETRAFGRLDPVTGTLMINSTPPGAQVYLNGQIQAPVTPGVIKVAPGKYKLTLRMAGYKDEERDIEIRDATITHLELGLSAQP